MILRCRSCGRAYVVDHPKVAESLTCVCGLSDFEVIHSDAVSF